MAFLPGDHIFISRGVPSVKASIVDHHAIVVATISADQVDIVEHGVYNKKDGTKKWVAGTGIDQLLHDVGEVKRRTIDLKAEPGWTMATNLADAFPPHAVVERALFILDRASLLPAYHLTNCNGECVARWCKTGRFESTQAKSLYDVAVDTINEKVAPAMDTSGKAVSKAIAPKATTTPAPVTGTNNEATTTSTSTGVDNNTNSSSNNNTMARTQEKASSAIQLASDKIVAAVRAVGAMVGNRQQEVFDKWAQTNEVLDLAFAQYKST